MVTGGHPGAEFVLWLLERDLLERYACAQDSEEVF